MVPESEFERRKEIWLKYQKRLFNVLESGAAFVYAELAARMKVPVLTFILNKEDEMVPAVEIYEEGVLQKVNTNNYINISNMFNCEVEFHPTDEGFRIFFHTFMDFEDVKEDGREDEKENEETATEETGGEAEGEVEVKEESSHTGDLSDNGS